MTIPLLGPAIAVALLFRYIFAFRIFSEVWLMTQGGPARSTEVVAVYLYQEAFGFNAFGTAAATAWIMVVASLYPCRVATCSFFASRSWAMRIRTRVMSGRRSPVARSLSGRFPDSLYRHVVLQARTGHLRRPAQICLYPYLPALRQALEPTGACS